ncbi:MASE1 domain-containing protein [Oscillatoria sp. FACHB-1406]|uniref:MASE1 domain-containing protein n=1 Tax=Oscillatoria sp. FACHB-1406 TaxID=2692846 RepID=UPI001685FA59|nr:MASE1 domain-containing protein [Oscillatoria sp. FACHB-1406]
MPKNASVKITLVNFLVGLLYYSLAELSRHLASTPNSVTPVWPPDGLAVGVTLLYGNWMLPGVFLGSFLANIQAFSSANSLESLSISIFAVCGIAGGTTLGTFWGTSLLRRRSYYSYPFNRVTDVIKFLLYCGFLCPVVNATVGVAMLIVAAKIPGSAYKSVWLVWWISNVAGIFILTPLLLSVREGLQSWQLKSNRQHSRVKYLRKQPAYLGKKIAETIILSGLIFSIGIAVFWHQNTFAYMLIPLLVWSAFRFGHLGATLSVFVVATIAILGTVRNLGYFAHPDLNQSLLNLQSFIAVIVFTTLILMAMLSEQAQSRVRLKNAFKELQLINEALEKQSFILADRNRTLQETLQQLKIAQAQMIQSEKMSALGILVAGVAHEINNPLGFLKGSSINVKDSIQSLLEHLELYRTHYPNANIEILENAEDNNIDFILTDLPKLLESMKGATDRIQAISTSLGIFSRADTESKVLANLHDGLDSTLLILKYRLKANEDRPAIQVIKEYGDLPLVECFPGQLNQVFMNILANAIDALEESNAGRSFTEIQPNPNCITIRTRAEEEDVTIAIADNGKGMSPELKARIFDQLFTTKRVGKGTGLGLAIARQIIEEKHGGQLKVRSEWGQGTEFSIQLPLTN